MITARTNICIIIGDPVEHSLTPQMHNRAYKALGIDGEFVFIAAKVKSSDISLVITSLKSMQVRGITCTIPHKTAVMEYLDDIDDVAKKIGAVNTIVNNKGVLQGYNTDWLGIMKPLQGVTDLQQKRVAILGAGGAARAAVFACMFQGAQVTVY